MKLLKLLFGFIFYSLFLLSFTEAQWAIKYVTVDDTPNGAGNQTPSVAVFSEDAFVALATRIVGYDTVSCSYLVGYRNADSSKGRCGNYVYGTAATAGIYWKWGSGADTVRMYNAFKIVASPKDSLVFVANNDKDHCILTFKFKKDTVVPAPYRMKTGSRKIWGIDVDNNGKVYVCVDSASNTNESDIKIFESVTKEPKWQTTHDATPIGTLDLPASLYKGLAVDGIGKMLFVADFQAKKVVKYVGSPTGGYTKASGFDFHLTSADSMPGNIPPIFACPIGLSYMRNDNILLVACDTFLRRTSSYAAIYSYGRIYLVDPNTGKLVGDVVGDPSLSLIDQAKWDYDQSGGSYTYQSGTASGYTSTYDVGYDDQSNVYSLSFYSWQIEKWNYFPIIPVLTSVRSLPGIPDKYAIKQNYPNPFNPSTNIEFSIPTSSLVTLKVFNMLGQEVATVLNELKEAGNYKVTFNASKIPSGIYFYSIQADKFSAKMKMVLVK
jgi:hypothetical protein